jgi:hypothetical protein
MYLLINFPVMCVMIHIILIPIWPLLINYQIILHFIISFWQHDMHNTSTYDILTVTSFKPIYKRKNPHDMSKIVICKKKIWPVKINLQACITFLIQARAVCTCMHDCFASILCTPVQDPIVYKLYYDSYQNDQKVFEVKINLNYTTNQCVVRDDHASYMFCGHRITSSWRKYTWKQSGQPLTRSWDITGR